MPHPRADISCIASPRRKASRRIIHFFPKFYKRLPNHFIESPERMGDLFGGAANWFENYADSLPQWDSPAWRKEYARSILFFKWEYFGFLSFSILSSILSHGRPRERHTSLLSFPIISTDYVSKGRSLDDDLGNGIRNIFYWIFHSP
jgi:hypothetical protein